MTPQGILGGFNIIKFGILTFIAYISIDIAVYWLGNKGSSVSFTEIATHHFKMLPIYLIANVLITTGFIFGTKTGIQPMFLFGLSISIWVLSLIIVGMALYKIYPGWISILGLSLILLGAVLVQYNLRV